MTELQSTKPWQTTIIDSVHNALDRGYGLLKTHVGKIAVDDAQCTVKMKVELPSIKSHFYTVGGSDTRPETQSSGDLPGDMFYRENKNDMADKNWAKTYWDRDCPVTNIKDISKLNVALLYALRRFTEEMLTALAVYTKGANADSDLVSIKDGYRMQGLRVPLEEKKISNVFIRISKNNVTLCHYAVNGVGIKMSEDDLQHLVNASGHKLNLHVTIVADAGIYTMSGTMQWKLSKGGGVNVKKLGLLGAVGTVLALHGGRRLVSRV